MQQAHTTAKQATAATFCAFLKIRSGKTTSTDIRVILEPYTALSTSCLMPAIRSRAITYSPKATAVVPLLDRPAPCAFCHAQSRSTVAMVPARTQCPDGWTTEYAGYIMTGGRTHSRSSYICWDEAPEVTVGGTSQNQALIYPVEVSCGSLPCSVYISGRELNCVVCSK